MRNITSRNLLLLSATLLMAGCFTKNNPFSGVKTNSKGQEVYMDRPYLQDYSVKYYLTKEQLSLNISSLSANRDGQIRVLSDKGIIVPDNGSLFYSGKFIPDVSYTPLVSKNIKAIRTYLNQTVYLDDHQVFSNAWAGKIQIDHGLPNATLFEGGIDFHFLVSDGEHLVYLDKTGKKLWNGSFKNCIQLCFEKSRKGFLLISPQQVAEFIPGQPITILFSGTGITCAETSENEENVVVGTSNGYFSLSDKKIITSVPCPNLSTIRKINGQLWFGTSNGVFRLNDDGKYSYYAGERWLPGNLVKAIEVGPDNSVLVLTDKGLGQICFKEMTLEDKAMFYEKQVREKNIRYGFNCSSVQLTEDYSSAKMSSQPSDNLWTGMYLASQLFRYKVTGSCAARHNAFEAFEAMERLFTVTNIPGLFGRSFERDYKIENNREEGWEKKEVLSGSPASLWLPASDHHNWTWRSTASSDQTVGQIFALTTILELSDDDDWKERALKCLDNLMGYIVKNNLYIIDVDGKPTLWGKWNPDYVNKFPVNVGDRKINSSNIIAFLQTAYHFTKKELYKNKAIELMEKYGYLDNLMRPMSQVKPDSTDELSTALSEAWNHSDDEMYFLGYWGLHPYALNQDLKTKIDASIKDHWEIERPEKNALWNFTYAMTGAHEFDLDPSVWFLKTYPMDLRNWGMKNSHRKDIELLPANFRGQTTRELLPLGEIPLYRHNGQIFTLDSDGDGTSLISAGDTWLLPYWMGRYLGIISPPVKNEK